MSVKFQQVRKSNKTVLRRNPTAPPFLEDKKPREGTKFTAYEETWENTIDQDNPAPGVNRLLKQEAGEVYVYVDKVADDDPEQQWATTEDFDLVVHDRNNKTYHRLNLLK